VSTIGVAPLQQQVTDGTATLDGDPTILQTLAGALIHFEPTFGIMPATMLDAAAVPAEAFAYRDLADSSGG